MILAAAFPRFWLATTVSALGNGIRFTALPLVATRLDPSPLFVGTVYACTTLPWLVLSLPAGVFVDRLPRGPVVVASHAARGIAGLGVAGALGTGRLTPLLLVLFALLLGAGDVFADLATHALLPSVVPADRLEASNSRLLTAESVSYELVGPAVGGVLFGVAVGLPVAVDALTFVAAAALFLPWARDRDRTASAGQAGHAQAESEPLRALAEGVRWFVRARFVRSLSLVGAAMNAGLGGLYAVLVVLATRTLGLGPARYGWLLAAGAVGSIGAGWLLGRWTREGTPGRDTTPLLLLTAPALVGCLAVTAFVPMVAAVVAAQLGIGAAVMVFNAVAQSRRQALVPAELFGRVFSVHRLIGWGALPLGALLAGWVADRTDPRWGIAACAAVVVLGWAAALPGLRAPAGSRP